MSRLVFNVNLGAVKSSSANKLVVTVPDKAGAGHVVVTVNSVKAIGPVFDYVNTAEVTTFAGSTFGFTDGTGTTAKFNYPYRVATDAQGNVYVSDYSNSRIRKISPSGDVSTLAGSGIAGFADGAGTVAQFSHPTGIGSDAQGNVYEADYDNHRNRKINSAGIVSAFAGSDTAGSADGAGPNAKFTNP